MLDKAIKQAFEKPLNLTKGVSIDELLGRFADREADRLAAVIRLAHHEGWTNDQLVRAIRGTKKGGFQDGILNATKREAQTIARTGTAIMSSEAQKEFVRQNADIIKGIQVLAVLDSRTSVICRHLDHTIMPVDKAKYPPYHYNCRSAVMVIYDGVEMPKHRTSQNGVTKNVSYYEWLKNQSLDTQELALGKTRAALFRRGDMSVERFKALQLDKNFEPLTLAEIIKLEQPSYQTIHLGNLKPRQSEVKRLQIEPTKRGERPKTPRPAEAELADLLQQYFGIYLVRYDDRYHKSTGNPPDFAKKDIDLPIKEWQTLDVMGAMLADDVSGITAMNFAINGHKRQVRNWRVLQEQIVGHTEKADIVPIDLRHWNDENRSKIIDFVLSLTDEQKQKIIFIEK